MADWYFQLLHNGLNDGNPVVFYKARDLHADDADVVARALVQSIGDDVHRLGQVAADDLSVVDRVCLEDEWRRREEWLGRFNNVIEHKRPNGYEADLIKRAHDMAEGMADQLRGERAERDGSKHPDHVAAPSADRTNDRRQNPASRQLEWQRVQRLLLDRLQKETLPTSIRDAAKAVNANYNSARAAVHKSDSLRTHFNIQDDTPVPGDQTPAAQGILDELAQQADRPTTQYLKGLPGEKRQELESQMQQMKPAKRLDLVKTMAHDPDAGRTGDVPYNDNSDSAEAGDDSDYNAGVPDE